ncbi:hypothetical protein BC826DRAFT_968528 [Russula brevipes]|nr:hypothetical protein BC826DRAFT_968528 [Russula brevipes]
MSEPGGIIEILTIIVTGAELVAKISEVAGKIIPAPPKDLTEKFRWIQCTIKNESQFDVLLMNTYFDSGRYWDAPGSFNQFDQSVFSCCNGDSTILTGVSGGTAFRISLDDTHYYDIAFGWTNPTAGSFKAGVVESSQAKDGFQAASPNGGSIQSTNVYEGKDKNGNPAKFKLHVSAAPGPKTLYVIKQVPVV